MFFLVPAHLGSPRQRAVKRLLLMLSSLSECDEGVNGGGGN